MIFELKYPIANSLCTSGVVKVVNDSLNQLEIKGKHVSNNLKVAPMDHRCISPYPKIDILSNHF